nr:immunoglobulin heavy chain junction region [Mus musculus]
CTREGKWYSEGPSWYFDVW